MTSAEHMGSRDGLPGMSSAVWVVGLLVLLLALAITASANAGTYKIDNCPSAPGGNGNAGAWTVFGSPQAPQGSCSGSGGYIGPQGGELTYDSNAGVQIAAPEGSGITIREAQVWWTALQSVSGAHVYAIASASSGAFWQSFAPAEYRWSPLTLQPPSTTTELTLDAYCSADDGGSGCTFGSGEDPILQLFGAQLTLEDNSLPSGNVTGGGLAGSGTVSGTQALTYTASDPNSGVRAVDLLIDGDQVAQNDYGARCPYQNFLACPATVSDSISWNTAGASAGSHEVALKVVSAAGDTAIVDAHDVTVGDGGDQTSSTTTGSTTGTTTGGGTAGTTDNPSSPLSPISSTPSAGAQILPGAPPASPGPANGTHASDQAALTAHWTRTAGATLTGRYGAGERVTGRLTTTSGQPITDATIDASETPSYTGAHAQALSSPRTGPGGEWSLTLPRDLPSSSLRFAYRSHLNDTTPAATAALTLRMHPGIAFGIAPRVASVGRRIYFSGIVHGPIPPGGKQLVLEASSGREWIQFETVHTNTQGRYRASYRFKFPGPVTYRFRVVSPYEADFPFLAGRSDDVAVHEL